MEMSARYVSRATFSSVAASLTTSSGVFSVGLAAATMGAYLGLSLFCTLPPSAVVCAWKAILCWLCWSIVVEANALMIGLPLAMNGSVRAAP